MRLFQGRVAGFMIYICVMCVFIIYTAKSKVFPVIEVFSDSRKIPGGSGILGGK